MKGKSKMKRSSFFPFYFCLLYLTRTSVLTFLSSMYIIPSPAIVAADLPLPDALALLSQTEEGCILVTEEEQLKGILTEKDVVRAIASGIAISRSAIADVMMREVMSLTRSEAEDILKVLALFQERKLLYLPIIDDRDRVSGLITQNSLIQAITDRQLEEKNNISDRQATEEALRESEERWQLAVRGTNDGIWDWNIKTNEVFFSSRWKEMLGYEEEEIINHLDEWTNRVHPDDLGWVTEAIQEHFKRKTPFYITEHRVRCKDGSYKWILDRGQALWDEAGNAIRMAGSHTDITERKLAEEELRLQNERSQLFADISLKIRQSLEPEEILQTSVTEVQKLLKADRVLIFRLWEDGSGTVVQESVLPDFPVVLGEKIDDPCFSQEYQEKYRQGRVSTIVDIEQAEIQECHANLLKQFRVKANLVVPIIERENCWGLLIAHQCSSPREWIKFEVELLQSLANQIGIALAQARLLQRETEQRQELARSNADLEQFAYIASHDLQEPLRMVTSYLQLLQKRYRDKLDADADEFIAYAVDGATRMQGLIQDLLSYSRVSTRGQPFKTVNGDRALRDALDNLKMAIAETNAIVTFDPLPQVMADGIQLTQLFQNLIANAIKFRREIPLKIHVGVKKSDENWLFSVSDNGIGIEEQYFEKIFLIFQRLHRRTDYPGTGIGLAICKKIVERHGGKIWLESKPNRGSIFYFTMPQNSGNK
jgi:hypothetical protein